MRPPPPHAGHLPALQWLRAEGCPWSEAVLVAAAAGGHLELFQFAAATAAPRDWHRSVGGPCEAAAEAGHLALFKWAVEKGGFASPWLSTQELRRSAVAAGLKPELSAAQMAQELADRLGWARISYQRGAHGTGEYRLLPTSSTG